MGCLPFNGDMKTLTVLILTIVSAFAADTKTKTKMTKAEQTTVAERYATRAEELASKAKKHEENAVRLKSRQGYNAMQHKWPGLANGAFDLERGRAMQARRAEAESRKLAEFHAELATKTVDAEP